MIIKKKVIKTVTNPSDFFKAAKQLNGSEDRKKYYVMDNDKHDYITYE